MVSKRMLLRTFIISCFIALTTPVLAQEVPIVTLGALNKITAKLETLNVARDETVKFGTLEITMRNCRSNPPEETPESVACLEITDLGHVGEPHKIFSGWMFASTPAVSPLEHAVYDVWVTDCKMVDPSASSDSE